MNLVEGDAILKISREELIILLNDDRNPLLKDSKDRLSDMAKRLNVGIKYVMINIEKYNITVVMDLEQNEFNRIVNEFMAMMREEFGI